MRKQYPKSYNTKRNIIVIQRALFNHYIDQNKKEGETQLL